MKLLLLTFCSLFLFACESEELVLNQPDVSREEEPAEDIIGIFTAKILSINENSAVVFAEDISGHIFLEILE